MRASSTWACCSSAFQADLEAEASWPCRARLNGEPLEEYIKPVGGGYFFALPGVESPRDYLAKGLLETNA